MNKQKRNIISFFIFFSQHDRLERTLRGSVAGRARERHARQIQDRISGGRLFQANRDRFHVPDDRRDV